MNCIYVYTDPGGVYPVVDPRRVGGEGPLMFEYGFAWDFVVVTVEAEPTLRNNEMLVGLGTYPGVTWEKDILAWNYSTGTAVSSVSTRDANHGPNYMLIRKTDCSSGTSTLLLRKLMTWNQMTGLYTFDSREMWDFWGGMKVTLKWLEDRGGTNVWGPNIPPIRYGGVAFRDGTLIGGGRQPGVVYVVVGGAKFRLSPNPTAGTAVGNAEFVDQATLDRFGSRPADFTVVKDPADPSPYVCFGGARFPFVLGDPRFSSAFATEVELNFGFINLHLLSSPKPIPPGTATTIPRIPRDRTLLREADDPNQRIFYVDGGELRQVASPAAFNANALATRNIRTVPPGSLASLPTGPMLV